MMNRRIVVAAAACFLSQPSWAAEPEAPQPTTVVSVFDGSVLLMRATLPSDATTEILSDASTGGGDRPASFTGNVVLKVRKDGRQLMSLAGDRMEVEQTLVK